MTSRIARTASRDGIHLSRLTVTVTQGFAAERSFARGEAVGLVFDLSWEIEIEADVDGKKIHAVVDEAPASAPTYAALTA